jgi:hypothetical protein
MTAKRINIGFTGTRNGFTDMQTKAFRLLFADLLRNEVDTFHHGDCIGADQQAHVIVCEFMRKRANPKKIIIHPPTETKYQAHCWQAVRMSGVWVDQLEPQPYLIRNEEIVRRTDLLIAIIDPASPTHGTRNTVAHAVLKRKYIYMVWPDGVTTEEQHDYHMRLYLQPVMTVNLSRALMAGKGSPKVGG